MTENAIQAHDASEVTDTEQTIIDDPLNSETTWQFIQRNFFSITYCGIVGLLIAQSNSSLGVDHLFMDGEWLDEQISQDAAGIFTFLRSHSLWTAFSICSFSFIAWYFMRVSWNSTKAAKGVPPLEPWHLFRTFSIPTFFIAALYIGIWLIFGRSVWSCDPDILKADCTGQLRLAEFGRIVLGFAFGVFGSFVTIVVFGRGLVKLHMAIRSYRQTHSITQAWEDGKRAESDSASNRVSLWIGVIAFVATTIAILDVYFVFWMFAAVVTTQVVLYLRRDFFDKHTRARRYLCFVTVLLTAVTVVFFLDTLIPAVGIFALVSLIYIVSHVAFDFNFWWRIVAVVACVIATLTAAHIANEPYKLSFDGIVTSAGQNAYDDPFDLGEKGQKYQDHLDNLSEFEKDIYATCSQPGGSGEQGLTLGGGPYDLIDPIESLNAWFGQVASAQKDDGTGNTGSKPKLVMVTTSGGAYRSAFWTAMILDRIAEHSGEGKELAGFIESIRIITGASGGMIGGAYMAALSNRQRTWTNLQQAITDDIEKSQRRNGEVPLGADRFATDLPIERDSLTPVIQQLLQQDLPHIFAPWRAETDRGEILERQWLKLSIPFANLREGEAQGWRPSIIFSPMMIESGQPLLISNLDISSLDRVDDGQAVQFFDLFPCSRATFKLTTAARMNASFPYVSPAVSLPTTPYRRVVDAGYYDNYGVSMASAFLSDPSISKWVVQNTSGVIVLELRAFPLNDGNELHCTEPEKGDDALPTFSFLTSPVEGAIKARGTTMVFRNTQELESVNGLYHQLLRTAEINAMVEEGLEQSSSDSVTASVELSKADLDSIEKSVKDRFISRIIFVNATPISMSWQVAKDEEAAMQRCLDDQWENRWQELKRAWDR